MHIVEKEFKIFLENNNFKEYFIAYSGGVDSQVLLHLAAKLLNDVKVTALHVNHGISNNSKIWEKFCRDQVKSFELDIKVAKFNLKEEKANLEEKARNLRHEFFEDNLSSKTTDEATLMTGHHLDDQAETFMLRLMRGSGVDGLSAMQPSRPMKKGGTLTRPLLNVSKEEIKDYAVLNDIDWVEDESNQSSDYDRNFLRNEVLPLLQTRWKGANKSIAKSAASCQVAQKDIQECDKEAIDSVIVKNKVNIQKLEEKAPSQQNRIIRHWLKMNDKKMLNRKALNSLLKDVLFETDSNLAHYRGKNYNLRKHKGFLCMVNDSDLKEFVVPDGVSVVKEDKNILVDYKGMKKGKRSILKDKNIPYWLRSYYHFLEDKDGVVVSLGDIKLN